MKTGDLIQIRQHENLHDTPPPVADPPVPPGPIDFWVFARVMEVLDDGRLRVIVEHPGNHVHAQEQIVLPLEDDGKGNPRANVRGKAEVMALHDAVKHPNPQTAARLREHFKVQADRLS